MSSKTWGGAIPPAVVIVAGAILFLGRASEAQDFESAKYTDPGSPSASTTDSQLNFQTDRFTGRFNYSIPIKLPPARGLEPTLALSYSSTGGNGWLGVGWTLDVGCIERDTDDGVPVTWVRVQPPPTDPQAIKARAQYDDAKGFVARINGSSVKLVQVGTQGAKKIFRPEIDQDFMRFEFDTTSSINSWTAVDKGGNRFEFGKSATTRLRHDYGFENWVASGNDVVSTFAWYLERITDTNENETRFNYQRSDNQHYLATIWYNGRGSAVTGYTHFVTFNRDGATRPDVVSDCRSAICRKTRYRLDNIAVTINPPSGGTLRVRRYKLAYAQSPTTNKSRLVSVTEQGSDYNLAEPTALPPVTFSYHDGTGWGSSPAQAGDDRTLTWSGLDETGAWQPPTLSTDPTAWQGAQAVKGRDYVGAHGTSSPHTWPTVSSGFYEMNGDTLPDRVARRHCNPVTCSGDFFIQMQNRPAVGADGVVTGGSLAPGLVRKAVAQNSATDERFTSLQYVRATDGTIRSTLLDLDGDGAIDKVEQKDGSTYRAFCVDYDWPSVTSPSTICGTGNVNIENDFSGNEQWGSPVSCKHEQNWLATVTRAGLFDMNGDGRPDWVRLCVATTSPFDARILSGTGAYFEGHAFFLVQLNTGVRGSLLFDSSVQWLGVDGNLAGPQFMGNPDDRDDWFHLASVMDVGQNTYLQLADMNGDGLTDRVMREPTMTSATGAGFSNSTFDAFGVQLNNGIGFEPVEWWRIDHFGKGIADWSAWSNPVGRATGGRTIATLDDVTGDGLPDRVTIDPSGENDGSPPFNVFKVQANTGSGFAPAVSWSINSQGQNTSPDLTCITWSDPNTSDIKVDLIDIDGDGLKDRVMTDRNISPTNTDPIFKVELCRGPPSDIMTRVTSGLDSEVEVKYRPASHFDNTDPVTGRGMLPRSRYVVSSTTASDAHEALATQVVKYSYRGGFYDLVDREFRGFHEVTQDFVPGNDDGGTVPRTRVVTRYHQGGGIQDAPGGEFDDTSKAKSGMPYRVETYLLDPDLMTTTLLKRTFRRVEVVGLDDDGTGPKRWFPHVSKTIEETCNGLAPANARAAATTVEYDQATLNPLREHHHGEVRVGDIATHATSEDSVTAGDETTTVYQYAVLAQAPDIRDRRSLVKVCASASASDCTQQDSLGWTAMTYDQAKGNLLTRTRVSGTVSTRYEFQYDTYGNVIRQIDPSGAHTTLSYNHFNGGYHVNPERSVSDARPDGVATGTFAELEVTRTYDPASGQVLEATGPSGVVTRYRYDPLHRLIDVDLLPEGAAGPVINLQEYVYNLKGVTADAGNANTSHQNYQVTRNSDGYGGFFESWTFLDGMGRPIQTWTELERLPGNKAWQVSGTSYDGRGRLRFQFEAQRVLLPEGESPAFDAAQSTAGTHMTYDALGRPLVMEPPDGTADSLTAPSTIAYSDGADPWATVTTDPRGNTRTIHHDANGKVVRIEDEIGEETKYGYDRLGRLTSIVDARLNGSQFEYDKLGRKLASVDRDTGRWEYEYDAASRLIRQTDAIGNRIEYDHDGMNRVTERRTFTAAGPLEETTRFLYDRYDPSFGFASATVYKGQLYAVVKLNAQGQVESAVANSYNRRGQTLRSDTILPKNGTTYTLSYEYNDAGAVRRVTYPKGLIVDYSYTSSRTLRRIESVAGTGPRTVFYDVATFDRLNRPLRFDLGDGRMRTDVTLHDHSSRVDRIHTTVPSTGATLQDVTHAWDAAGNLARVTDAMVRNPADPAFLDLGLGALTYDPLNRLTFYRHTRTGAARVFAYDAIGNMTRNDETAVGTAEDYAYAGSGHAHPQPHAATSANGRTYTYDRNGNMIRREAQTLAWSANNQLVGVTSPAGLDVAFGYGPDDARLWKQTRSTGALVVWIGDLFEHRDGKFMNYIVAGGRRIATVQQQPAKVQAASLTGPQPLGQPAGSLLNKTFYQHVNHLQSPVVVTDDQGAVVRQQAYSAFGRTLEHVVQAGFAPGHLYTDQVLDRDTGLYYYKARYYDPELGRFIQPDSVVPDSMNPQGLNRYTYVLNNPLRYVDPSGQFFYEIAVAAVVAAYQYMFNYMINYAIAELSGDDPSLDSDEFFRGVYQAAARAAVLQAASSALDALSAWEAMPDIIQQGLSGQQTCGQCGTVIQEAGFLNYVLSRVAVTAVFHEDRALDLKYTALTSSLAWVTNRGLGEIKVDSFGAVVAKVFLSGVAEGGNSLIYAMVYKPGEFGPDTNGSFLAGFKNGAIKGGVMSLMEFDRGGGSLSEYLPGTGIDFTIPGVPGSDFSINLGSIVVSEVIEALQGDAIEVNDAPEGPDDPTGDGSGHGT